jgi:hypothetical protein
MNIFCNVTRVALAEAFFVLAANTSALAVTNAGAEIATPYVAAFAPIFGVSAMPHTGTMRLLIHDGIVSGTYTGTSISPDPLDSRIVAVTGSMSDGYVQIYVGGYLSVRGTVANDGTISGTASYRGRLYQFVAKPGTVGK